MTLQMIRWVLACVAAIACGAAHAAEVRVLVAGAAKAAFEGWAPGYERISGNTLRASFDTVGALRDRVTAGERPDLVILSAAAVDVLAQRGWVAPQDCADMGWVVTGLAVRQGAVVPDISTEPLLRQALLAAESIAHADGARGATSGGHFAKVIDAMGLREALQARVHVLPFGVDVIQGVADGKFAIGVSQSSEIMPLPGVQFVGALPAPYGLRTLYEAAAVSGSAEGRLLLRHLQSDAVRSALVAAGLARP